MGRSCLTFVHTDNVVKSLSILHLEQCSTLDVMPGHVPSIRQQGSEGKAQAYHLRWRCCLSSTCIEGRALTHVACGRSGNRGTMK